MLHVIAPAGSTVSASIRQATAQDLMQIELLLVASNLPTVGVGDALCGFLVAEHEGAVVGVVGVEERCEYGLLRSTAVASEWRSRGLGRQLVARAIVEAESRGVKALYLLTTTAERYFPSFGFTTITRDQVPEPVRATAEFCTACPASATVMTLRLNDT
ncbi:MAG: arsenic resistance N-acetyltransferase ArsN2 [Gemmatimonadaceae bacterium]